MKERIWKIAKTLTIVSAVLFVLSLIVYFFNLDMKLAARCRRRWTWYMTDARGTAGCRWLPGWHADRKE